MESDKISCSICGQQVHSIELHLRDSHPEVSLSQYKNLYPQAPLLSATAIRTLEQAKASKRTFEEEPAVSNLSVVPMKTHAERVRSQKPLHEVFGMDVPELKSKRGGPIPITVFEGGDDADMIPRIDEDYVFDPVDLKHVMLGIELNIPVYMWGHTGTGKTEMYLQIAARTGRPCIRVQHTLNTEESHIIGSKEAGGGSTYFGFGPLPIAMQRGWMYIGDEYDFGMPNVLAVYQPVLEGNPLVIKEAPPHQRVITPDQDFRIVANGNTNGTGDETGLYQGTLHQNSANYDRFMVVHKKYMPLDREQAMLVKRAGIPEQTAQILVKFADTVRTEFQGSKLSTPISPRTLINIARLGMRLGSYRTGVNLAFTNKLSRADAEAVTQVAQRFLGGI